MRSRNFSRRNQQRHRRSFRSFSGRRSPSSRIQTDTNWVPFSYTDDEKWKTFYANGRPKFQKNCILFCVVFFECDEKDVFWRESHSHIGLHHAEVKALKRIVMEEKRYRSSARWVQLYLSYSPCGTCANEIILFTQKRPNCNVFIAFSCLYRHNKEQIHRNGLRLLDAEPRISIKVFTKLDWKTLAQATGRQYRANRVRDGWDSHWQLELSNILLYEDQPKNYATVKKPELAASTLPGIVRDEPQEIRGNAWTVLNKPREISSTTNEAKGHHPIQDRTKNYATVKKPELDLAASTLPGIVRDKPQEIRGNAWTVLNKPREISSTTNEAKGQPIQVQPRRKKNDMVENGVFPSDSEVSNSSLFDPDQIKSNAIFPPSTADQSQPQEQTVIDIQEDRTKNYSPVKKPKLKPAVSSLPSIVPDISQERRGNARTVLNKPMEISSTTDEAKGQPIQVQPRGKKNDMVENGVFPSDSEVSNSSLIDPDQIRSNAIFPPSTADQSQPQEQTVIDIPEPKEDQEQAVCRKNRRREIVAIIIFVVLISIAIVLLIIFGQWS